MHDVKKILFIIVIAITYRATTDLWKLVKRYLHYRGYYRVFLPLIERLYAETNGFLVSTKERAQQNHTDQAFIYGEVIYSSFAELLRITAPKQDEVFYDLGSGAGKAVLWTSLLYPSLKCFGIEFLTGLYQLSLAKKQELLDSPEIQSSQEKPKIEFINTDILQFDFSNADIIFINATCFTPALWNGILAKFRNLKRGTRIIVSSKNLVELSYLTLINYGFYQMSWGLNPVYIYKKTV